MRNVQPEASHFIGGAYVEDTAGAAVDCIYPATGEVVARLHEATPAIVERALAAGQAAQAELGGAVGDRARPDPASGAAG